MYLQKIISRKTYRIHFSEAWIRGSGSGFTPKCHGSETLFLKKCLTNKKVEDLTVVRSGLERILSILRPPPHLTASTDPLLPT
jgi:hypothetical protein